MTKANIAVVGAGLMGHGIAQVFALAGHQVTITDSVVEILEVAPSRIAANLRDLGDDESAVSRVCTCIDLAEAVRGADYIVEAVLEDLPLKQKLFAEIERHARARCDPCQQYFGDPYHRYYAGIKQTRARTWHTLVESTVSGPTCRGNRDTVDVPEVVAWTMELHKAAGKKPAHVKKDVPGFIGNRLQHALWREAIALVEHGICDAETVDTVIKASFGRRLAVLGPLANADLVGTDLTLAIHKTVLPAIDSRPGPSPYLEILLPTASSGSNPARAFASGVLKNKPRSAPRL